MTWTTHHPSADQRLRITWRQIHVLPSPNSLTHTSLILSGF